MFAALLPEGIEWAREGTPFRDMHVLFARSGFPSQENRRLSA